MKNLLIPFLAVVVMTTFSSCLFKSYTCQCTTYNKSTNSTSTENFETIGGALFGGKSSAKSQCENNEIDDSYETVTCVLK